MLKLMSNILLRRKAKEVMIILPKDFQIIPFLESVNYFKIPMNKVVFEEAKEDSFQRISLKSGILKVYDKTKII